LIETIEIGHVRSFFSPQKVSLAQPNGERGSGLNIFVGKNNSGKSTVLKLLRDLISYQPTMTIGSEARHDDAPPTLSVIWKNSESNETIEIDRRKSGGLFQKKGNISHAEQFLRYVPSRRSFASEFNSTSVMAGLDYERNDYINRRNSASHFDTQLGSALAPLLMAEEHYEKLLELMKGIDPRITALDVDNVGGKDVIRFRSASGRWHLISDTGDGIVNLVRIVHALVSSQDKSAIIIDEPELSLHPQFQRNLYKLIAHESRTKQIVVATHSPHFVSWADISQSGRLARVFLDDLGQSRICTAADETLIAVRSIADNNVTNRKYFDAVCKELFFTDEALLVEGPDDVHYINNFIESAGHAELPLMGYGCGGAEAIKLWMRLCKDLGIRCAGLYDLNKKAEFERVIAEFKDDFEVAAFILNRNDIRDKYRRDEKGRETGTIIDPGVFRRDGEIDRNDRGRFELLVRSIREFLKRDGEVAPTPLAG
jgi:ABC-type cobalamin/Fe3+-siderophores transport system ATPase subunit